MANITSGSMSLWRNQLFLWRQERRKDLAIGFEKSRRAKYDIRHKWKAEYQSQLGSDFRTLACAIREKKELMSKESKKRNALKHGANAQEVMLWGEKYEDYKSLGAELDLEFTPSGSTEKYLVQTLLDLRWRRRRLDCHEQITIQKRLDKIREENETSRHIENLRSFASEFHEATSAEKVEALLAPLSFLYSNTIRKRWPLQTGEDPNTWGPKIAKGLLSWIPPRRHEQADEFIAIVDLETFDMALARIERLDAMIDRTIKRLMQVKTMKQMHSRLEPKLINLSATKDPSAHDGTENPSNE